MLKTLSKITLGAILAVIGLAQTASAAPINIITNGDFETGDLTGWTATTYGNTSCIQDWHADSAGGIFGCVPLFPALSGAAEAFSSFSGNGPLVFELAQTINVPLSLVSAELSFRNSWLMEGNTDSSFQVEVNSDGVVWFQPIRAFDVSGGIDGFFDRTLDLTASLMSYQGGEVDLIFRGVIPDDFTGLGAFGLDDVALMVEVVPAPGALALLGLGLLGLGLRRRSN